MNNVFCIFLCHLYDDPQINEGKRKFPQCFYQERIDVADSKDNFTVFLVSKDQYTLHKLLTGFDERPQGLNFTLAAKYITMFFSVHNTFKQKKSRDLSFPIEHLITLPNSHKQFLGFFSNHG